MKEGEEGEVCNLVARVFDKYVAGDFSQEGVEEFNRYAEPNSLIERSRKGNKVLLAEMDGGILGMLELKGNDQIAMLFVKDRGRGLGRALVERALQICQEENEGPGQVSVNSSLYAVPIYRKLGFEPLGTKRTKNGITYVPMVIRFGKGG